MEPIRVFAARNAEQIRSALAAGLFDLEVRARARDLEIEEMDAHHRREERRASRLERIERSRARRRA